MYLIYFIITPQIYDQLQSLYLFINDKFLFFEDFIYIMCKKIFYFLKNQKYIFQNFIILIELSLNIFKK